MVNLGVINSALLELDYNFIDRNNYNYAPIPSDEKHPGLKKFNLNYSFDIMGRTPKLDLLTKKNPSNIMNRIMGKYSKDIDLGEEVILFTEDSNISIIEWPFSNLANNIINEFCTKYTVDPSRIHYASRENRIGSGFFTIINDSPYEVDDKKIIKNQISALTEVYYNFNDFLFYLDNKSGKESKLTEIYKNLKEESKIK